jgi:hypothetical protein
LDKNTLSENIGTLSYKCPYNYEESEYKDFKGIESLVAKYDIWSLGIIFHEIIFL